MNEMTIMNEKYQIPRTQGKKLVVFFSIAFIWTWFFWILRILILNDTIELPISEEVCKYLGGLGPLLAAITLTFLSNGKIGVITLLKRGTDFKFNKKWWIPLLLLTTSTAFLAYQLINILTPVPDIINLPIELDTFIGALLILTIISVAEEFGWRGYALDRLQDKLKKSNHTSLIASIILGMIWGIWHLPMFFTPNEGKSHDLLNFPFFLVMTVLLSILFTWFYNNTNMSILSAIVFHTTVNFSGIVVPITNSYAIPSSLGYLVLNSLILLFDLFIMKFFGSKNLRREQLKTIERSNISSINQTTLIPNKTT
jgi:membrane protease YdiL (CAAX protease family)